MIAIDTNVLLRYLLEDDPAQAKLADARINGPEPVLITDGVLVETLWTLGGKKYSLNQSALAAVVDALFAEPNLHFEDPAAVWAALWDFQHTLPVTVSGKRKQADFPGALIARKAQAVAERKGLALTGVYTFHKAAQQLPNVFPYQRPSGT